MQGASVAQLQYNIRESESRCLRWTRQKLAPPLPGSNAFPSDSPTLSQSEMALGLCGLAQRQDELRDGRSFRSDASAVFISPVAPAKQQDRLWITGQKERLLESYAECAHP